MAQPEQPRPQPTIPFQRANNAYWTLQTRKQIPRRADGIKTSNDDLQLANATAAAAARTAALEELYSTPNKLLKKSRPQLRPTAAGFSTYFSPIGAKPSPSEIVRAADSVKISPIDPRNTGGAFQTSTPTKMSATADVDVVVDDFRLKLHIQESGGSNRNSPINSGRSTPHRLEPQTAARINDPNQLSQTCSDRLGTPKTSLMDFKKLLLSKAGKSSIVAAKPSAVEQLRIARDAAAAAAAANVAKPSAMLNSSMNILDLSGSPKTFANRRMLRQGTFGSPSKTLSQSVAKHMSPRSAWKFANYRTDVMSTAIPEVNSEEDSSPNNSRERQSHQSSSSPAKRLETPSPPPPPPPEPEAADEERVCEERIDMKTNIFMQAEENNFVRGEVVGGGGTKSRAQLSAARSQFLMGGTTAAAQQQAPMRSAQFKNGHYTGISPTRQPQFISNTEAVVETCADGNQAASLETAL